MIKPIRLTREEIKFMSGTFVFAGFVPRGEMRPVNFYRRRHRAKLLANHKNIADALQKKGLVVITKEYYRCLNTTIAIACYDYHSMPWSRKHVRMIGFNAWSNGDTEW